MEKKCKRCGELRTNYAKGLCRRCYRSLMFGNRKIHSLIIELPDEVFMKLEKIIASGKYATKVDFFRTKIREERD